MIASRKKVWFWVIGSCVVGTFGLGIWLRWVLTGIPLPSYLNFHHLKHAHSHLGYYGVLFPLVWALWYQRDRFLLSQTWMLVYLLGIVLSTVGFVRAGYVLESIVGSSLVGGVWLVSAWKTKHLLWEKKSWLATAPVGIVLASLCVPPIAVMTRRNPTLALQLVQTFLSLLLFLVALPSVLERLRLSPPWMLYWLVCGVAGALFVGVVPHPILGAGLVGMAVWVQVEILQRPGISLDLRLLWSIWAVGTLALGLRWIPNNHFIAIAGLHLSILGPFLLGAGAQLAPRPIPALWRWPYVFALLLMVAAIAGRVYVHYPWLTTVSATAGSFLGVMLLILLGWWLRERRL